jgi:hypothetical protein
MNLQQTAVVTTRNGAIPASQCIPHGDEPVRGNAQEAGDKAMALTAIEDARAARAALTENEKAMLFDLAMEAGGFRSGRKATRTEALAAAPLILAFARAYVSIRDREEGLV